MMMNALSIRPLRALTVLLLTLLLIAPSITPVFAADNDKVVISNFKIYKPNTSTEEMPVSVSADGTVFTVDNTLGYDFEGLKSWDGFPKMRFNTNVARAGSYNSYNNITQIINPFFDQFNYLNPTVLPYDSDPDYVIAKSTLYVLDSQYKAIASTATDFTLRLKKWERQYQKEVQPAKWGGGFFRCSAYDNYLTSVPWKESSSQPYHFEFVAAENVTFPYQLTIKCGIYGGMAASLEGKRIYMPGPNTPYDKTLTFDSDKTYYDFVIDPLSSLDDKHTTGAKSYWRISVTGKGGSSPVDPPANTETNGAFTYSGAKVKASAKCASDVQWTGRQLKPALTVTAAGYKLKAGTDYTVSYGKNKDIGKGSLAVTGKGKYSGKLAVNFKIVPKKTSIASLSVGSKQLKATWKKVSSAQKITKYELRYRVKGTSKWKTASFKASASSASFRNLTKGKRYEVQVRSYKTVSGAKYYSAWSATKTSKAIK